MKTDKLSLDNFKVQSFVTSLTNETENTLKGGYDTQQVSSPCNICEITMDPAQCFTYTPEECC